MLLQIDQITRSFGGVTALAKVSFAIEQGSIHGLIGPNGAGKTTLINVLSGLSRPDSGRILLDEAPLEHLPSHRIAALGVARTFQNIRLFDAMNCLENVIAGQHLFAKRPLLPRLLQLSSARHKEERYRRQAMDCLERVGIAHRAHVLANSLSYGERRRLEIARALAMRPRLLLLDEPVAGMRQKGLEQVAELLLSLVEENMTILLIEHNMSFVMRLCSRITVLNFGSTLTTGTPQQITRHPQVIEAYLGGGASHA